MIVVGMALVWAGYTVGFYGFCLVKGYDVSFKQLVNPSSKGWYSGPWPPVLAPDNVILPTGGSGPHGGSSGKQNPPGSAAGCPPGMVLQNGRCVQKGPSLPGGR